MDRASARAGRVKPQPRAAREPSAAREPRAARDLVARVARTLERRGMLAGGETVLVAVSGGPDSLCLLNCLARLARPLRLRLHVAHFDHRLRDGSEKDAAFVARQARRLGLPFAAGAADSVDRPPGTSPEEAARERRLAFLEHAADSVGAARIATGHTLDDQAETVLMRLVSGTGRRGLGGIPPVRGRYIRPLIDVSRAEAAAFCRSLRLAPRIDPTNADLAFRRNAVRAEILPILAKRFNPRIAETLARSADVWRDEDAFLDERAREAIAFERAGDEVRIEVERLRALPAALRRRAVRAGAPDLGADGTERLLEMALSGETGPSIHLPLGLRARVEYGWLVLGREPDRPAAARPVRLEVPGQTDIAWWGGRIAVWARTERPDRWPDGRRACVVDAARVALPLWARRMRPGDRFRPFGLGRSKKLGDFFTDEKVPRAERARVPLVVAGDGKVVWVVGHRVDDRFRVTEETARMLWIEAHRPDGSRGPEGERA
ncbi:MAG: tRNA lysidine(34) synthetase TilS [Acidobacteria bacterium]|nr:tRNA lysidine(34) synthetase TilS [Acidobacteriota bacterium]